MITNEENSGQQLDDRFPRDPFMLLSFINMKLRDKYPEGLDSLCSDMNIDAEKLCRILSENGFEYDKTNNRFW